MRSWRLWELRGKSLVLVSSLLFLLSILNDPPWKWYGPSQRVQALGEPAHVVASLLENGAFANPFATLPTGPTAHVAPVFPFLQFLLIKLFGSGAAGWLAIRCLPTLALGLQFALLPYFGRFLGYSAWTGVLASVFGLIAKPAKEELWEAHLAGLVSLLLTVLFCRWITGPRTFRLAFTIGILGGLACLLQPVLGLVYFAWFAWMLWTRTLPGKFVLVLTLCPIVLCLPWSIRNFVALRGPLEIRDNLGLELRLSYNDCTPYGVRESERLFCSPTLHPNASIQEAAEVLRLGEYRYNQDRLRRAQAWILGHPGRAASLILQRFWFFWFPSDYGWEGYLHQRKRMLASHALTLASLGGLLLWFRRIPQTFGVVALWLVSFPLIYYVLQFESRYRYPILWITWILAAYVVAAASARIRSYTSAHDQSQRTVSR
jgi:hypothetical protein